MDGDILFLSEWFVSYRKKNDNKYFISVARMMINKL